jgi:putative dimethyl sulfoxide reductase chaperone
LIGMNDSKTKSSEIFRWVAELYKPPTKELWEEMTIGKMLIKLEGAAAEFYGIEGEPLSRLVPDNFEQFSDLFEAVLGNTEKQTVLPVESLYKQWTLDETCTLPFSKSKGYLQGDSAMHIQFILDKFQIDIPFEYRGMPDHLSILLELLAFFIEHSDESFTEGFISDHFDWLEDFEAKLAEVSGHPFYIGVTRFLIRLIKSQRSSYI